MDEVRITSDTGGAKGQKDDRQDLIDSRFLQELGLVCGFGAKKYSDDNWRRGYSWRLSFGAMLRHLHAFWRGEERDPESGLSHLAHAAWHCMVLFTFSERSEYARFDDRIGRSGLPKSQEELAVPAGAVQEGTQDRPR